MVEGLLSGLIGAVAVGAGAFWMIRKERYRFATDMHARILASTEELRIKHEAELQAQRATSERAEVRLHTREDLLDERFRSLESKEQLIQRQLELIEAQTAELNARLQEIDVEFHRVASLSQAEARDELLKKVAFEARDDAVKLMKRIEEDARDQADRNAKKLLLDVMQRGIVDTISEATTAVVELPSEDLKGRLIGREGRNIRAFEQVTGTDLLIDETPEVVMISCFDPIRREAARLTLINLMLDGRIHPSRIEEIHEKSKIEVERTIREAGERAAEKANVTGLRREIVEVLGRLRFRASYAQNVLDHSVEVARMAEIIAHELGFPAETTKRAALLHDIGKALGPEWEGPHAITGMEFLKSLGEKPVITHAVGAHHHEIAPETPEALIVILADTLSATRPGARRESLENYLKRMTSLEALANSFQGVERSYAVQAGREIRLIVRPQEIDDLGAARLAREVAKKIEQEMEIPGQVRVTVIREMRVTKKHESVHSFGWYMRTYIKGTKEKGATPIVCSYIPRCPRPDTKVEVDQNPSSYRLWAQQIAEQEKAPYIDLFDRSWKEIAKLEPAEIKKKFYCDADFTHTNLAGADLNALKVVEGLRDLKDCTLSSFLLKP